MNGTENAGKERDLYEDGTERNKGRGVNGTEKAGKGRDLYEDGTERNKGRGVNGTEKIGREELCMRTEQKRK